MGTVTPTVYLLKSAYILKRLTSVIKLYNVDILQLHYIYKVDSVDMNLTNSGRW